MLVDPSWLFFPHKLSSVGFYTIFSPNCLCSYWTVNFEVQPSSPVLVMTQQLGIWGTPASPQLLLSQNSHGACPFKWEQKQMWVGPPTEQRFGLSHWRRLQAKTMDLEGSLQLKLLYLFPGICLLPLRPTGSSGVRC